MTDSRASSTSEYYWTACAVNNNLIGQHLQSINENPDQDMNAHEDNETPSNNLGRQMGGMNLLQRQEDSLSMEASLRARNAPQRPAPRTLNSNPYVPRRDIRGRNGPDTKMVEARDDDATDIEDSSPVSNTSFTSNGSIGYPITEISPTSLGLTLGRKYSGEYANVPATLDITTPPQVSPTRPQITESASTSQGTVVIAHDENIQHLFDSMNIPWGIQYTIAYGVTQGLWTWDAINKPSLMKLKDIPSHVQAAPYLKDLVLPNTSSQVISHSLSIWEELDREEAARIHNPLACLGTMGEWQSVPNWYGGQLQQLAHIVPNSRGAGLSFTIKLDHLKKGKSSRFSRFLGSSHILQVKIPDGLLRGDNMNTLRAWLMQKFILCGKSFCPFAYKDKKIYMMEIQSGSTHLPLSTSQPLMTLNQLVQWHNPTTVKKNQEQPTSKWITRFDLGLSTTIPAVKFSMENIKMIEDQVAPHEDAKPSAEKIFTDGCGYLNTSALAIIGKLIHFDYCPIVVQGRFAGAKGLWMLHPHEHSLEDPPKIWTRRTSQHKIIYQDIPDPAHLIFDLVSPPHITNPSRLSKDTIMNLSYNGVPNDVFISFMKETLNQELMLLTTWDTQEDLVLLWHFINKLGNVTLSNIHQQAIAGARILGFGRDKEDNMEELGMSGQDSLDSSDDQPASLYGTVMELLQAGFEPLKLHHLYEKIGQILKLRIDQVVKEYRITIPLSAEAFMVPDPYEILEEGQIHFRSTQNLKDPLEYSDPTGIEGDVLIYRNPTRLPSDIQKVTAISCPKLREYVDVIVLPVKGSRSLASMLAGGDVDGDVGVCIYDPRIVELFNSAPINDPPSDFKHKYFESEDSIDKVANLDQSLKQLPPTEAERALQKVLLSGLSAPPIGTYSHYHYVAIYSLGYGAKETVRLAHMFTTVLDSQKTGLRVKDEVSKQDKRRYDRILPDCMEKGEVINRNRQDVLRRPPELGTFILDVLLEEGKNLTDECLIKYEEQGKDMRVSHDPDLVLPFKQLLSIGTDSPSYDVIQSDIRIIQQHVNSQYSAWRYLSSTKRRQSEFDLISGPTDSSAKAKFNKTKNNQEFRNIGVVFMQGPQNLQLLCHMPASRDEIMASCAYEKNPKFAFSVAFRTLCKIKADAVSSSISPTFNSTFAKFMSIPSSAIRVLKRNN